MGTEQNPELARQTPSLRGVCEVGVRCERRKASEEKRAKKSEQCMNEQRMNEQSEAREFERCEPIFCEARFLSSPRRARRSSSQTTFFVSFFAQASASWRFALKFSHDARLFTFAHGVNFIALD